MTSALGSIQISGLLGGTAGKIDTDALVSALMAAKSMPKQQLQLQVANQQKVTQAYQGLNTTMQAITTAASKALDTDSWSATKATSSSSTVVATSSSTAAVGASTFDVTSLAKAQVSTAKAVGGDWVTDYTQGIDITIGKDDDGNDIVHHLDLDSASVEDIAKAVNNAGIGVRAAVINVDDGAGGTTQVLQFSSAKTGTDNKFSVTGLTQAVTGAAGDASTITAAQNAQITVGNPAAGGYTISSQTNTFTDAMPGVTFTVSKVETGVTVSVASDTSQVAGVVDAMVSAVNSARLAVDNYAGKGGVLQGDSTARSLVQDMSFVFSSATASGKSLTEYGIDMSKDGLLSFDQDVFATAYAADPNGTMQAIADAVATPLKNISEASSAPVTGTISQLITSGTDRVTDLNGQIDSMTERLNKTEEQLRLKYIAMQTSLAKLQSQGDWLTSMFKSMQTSSDDK